MSKKIVDLTEYKNNQEDIEMMTEDIPEEILEAYMKEVENDTPDLWSKIETGYEKEIMSIDNEKKLRKKKTIGIIAAAALITLIAVPVAILNNKSTKDDKNNRFDISMKSDKADDTYDDYAADGMPEFADSDDDYDMYDESVNTEAAGENNTEQNNYSFDADVAEQVQDDYYEDEVDSDLSNEATDEEAADESLFAKEIEVEGVVYEISDVELITDVPDKYNNEIQIENIYCDYPEDTLYIYQMQENDAAIYVAYYDMYKLYVKKTESTLSK